MIKILKIKNTITMILNDVNKNYTKMREDHKKLLENVLADLEEIYNQEYYPKFEDFMHDDFERVMYIELTREQAIFLHMLRRYFDDFQGIHYDRPGQGWGSVNSHGFIDDLIRYSMWYWSSCDPKLEEKLERYKGRLPRDFDQFRITHSDTNLQNSQNSQKNGGAIND